MRAGVHGQGPGLRDELVAAQRPRLRDHGRERSRRHDATDGAREPLREQLRGGETELFWDESTDDLDPRWVIEYEVHVNGVYDQSLSLRTTVTIVCGTTDVPNTFSVIAVDIAGNRS